MTFWKDKMTSWKDRRSGKTDALLKHDSWKDNNFRLFISYHLHFTNNQHIINILIYYLHFICLNKLIGLIEISL